MDVIKPERLAGRTVLVTGGAGFIGSHLVETLILAGARVTVVDDLRTGRMANLEQCRTTIEYVQDDVLSATFGELLRAREFDLIFHLAANPYVPPSVEDPWYDFQLNVAGTLSVLEALRKTRPATGLIVASSAAVYGESEASSVGEEDPTVPISPYGVSKLAAERYVAVYAQLYGLRMASLRLFSVYGPRQRKQVVYDFMRKLGNGSGEIEALGDGTQVRDFNYVGDVVRAAVCAALNGALRGETYNVASGEPASIRELMDVLSDLMGVRPRVRWSGTVRPGDPQRWAPKTSRLRALGWKPSVPLREGLRRTVAWYRAEFGAEGGGPAR